MIDLNRTTDARVWAKEFVKAAKDHPSMPTDEASMVAWFASALMAGMRSHSPSPSTGKAKRGVFA